MRAIRIATLLLIVIVVLGQIRAVHPLQAQAQQPVLQVSPTSLDFQGQAGGPTPAPQALTIANAGGGLMKWHASADVEWIILGGTEGQLSGGRVIQLWVFVNTKGLAAGEYEGTITIEAPGAQGSPVVVSVTLILTQPALTVCPSGCRYSSIAKAIAAARSGATITIGPGTYEENLKITKSLTLKGAGRDRTEIKSKAAGEPVILIESESEIEVTLEGLMIAEATVWEDGIRIGGKARAIIRNSLISGNGDDGISMEGSSQAEISGSTISGNDTGIFMRDSSQATISDSQISGNDWYGIMMWGSSQATISDSQISGNDCDGIEMRDSSRAEIRDSRFLDNRGCGIGVYSEEATISGGQNEMKGNGADLCGYAPASLRKPLVPQTTKKQLSVPDDYPSIQEAIDAIALGGTITLAPGTYEAGLTIWKPLTLRGAGKEETVLEPLSNPTRRLIVSIIAGAKGVALEGLAVTGSEDGLLIYGEASLKGLRISGNRYNGIVMEGSSQATISDSKISGNSEDGIVMKGSPQATISGSTISGNGQVGIWMGGFSQATISDSEISGNGYGIYGIFMVDSSQAEIRGNKIFENKGYGVALWQRPCFDTDDKFEGKVEGSGNEIHDNGKGNVCPSDLSFLMTYQGGCYGPKC